jgi:hypothetical protein
MRRHTSRGRTDFVVTRRVVMKRGGEVGGQLRLCLIAGRTERLQSIREQRLELEKVLVLRNVVPRQIKM